MASTSPAAPYVQRLVFRTSIELVEVRHDGISGRALLSFLFVVGYLLTWAIAGILAFAAGKTAGWLGGGGFHWNHAGRILAGACRSPLGLLLGSRRDGPAGAVKMRTRNGAWYVGCCWALMASLFALGVMSGMVPGQPCIRGVGRNADLAG